MSDEDKDQLYLNPAGLPPDALGARVYVNGKHIGFLINPVYGKLMELRKKIQLGEVNEDGV